MPMIFVNLPAQGPPVSRAFDTALGFSANEFSSDEGTLSVVVDDRIGVALHTRDRCPDLVDGDVPDPDGNAWLVALPSPRHVLD